MAFKLGHSCCNKIVICHGFDRAGIGARVIRDLAPAVFQRRSSAESAVADFSLLTDFVADPLKTEKTDPHRLERFFLCLECSLEVWGRVAA